MSPIHIFELTLLLIAVVVALELLARRLRLPPAAALITGGGVLALIPGVPTIDLDPELALVLFLPPLLLNSAIFTSWQDFRDNLRIILQLALGAVVFTTLFVGVVTHWMMPALPWAVCFTMGAIVSPPDAVSAKAVLSRLTLPRRVNVLLEGESLINDASSLVLFRFAAAAALTGTFNAWSAAASFVGVAMGGIAAGVALGYAATWLLSRLKEPLLAIVGSLLTAWAAYIIGEALHVSGVLAVVCCGLVLGRKHHTHIGAATRVQAGAVWNLAEFLLESMVFILIGLSLRGVLIRLGDADNVMFLLPASCAIAAATILSRFVWMFPATYLPRFLAPSLRLRDPYPPVAVPLIMSWAGMRGVVSLAAALALPAEFPARDFIVATTFLIILITVLVQGATLAPLARMLNLRTFALRQRETMPEHEARIRMAEAAALALRTLPRKADGAPQYPQLIQQYGFRARAAARLGKAEDGAARDKDAYFEATLMAIRAARKEIVGLHLQGEIHDEVMQLLESELDLEEVSAMSRHRPQKRR